MPMLTASAKAIDTWRTMLSSRESGNHVLKIRNSGDQGNLILFGSKLKMEKETVTE
jgi:hypothetical protein